MNAIIDFFARQHTFVNILTVFVAVAGGMALWNLNRDAFPDVSFDIITITTPYPNASADSVESLITNPLESDLQEVEGVKEMNSISIEGRSVIILQLDPDQVSVEDAKSDALDVVDAFEDLPDGALDPVVIATDSNTRGLVEVAIGGEMPKEELRKEVKKLKRFLERIPGIASVRYQGLPEYELRVEADPEKMQKFGVGLTDLIRTLRLANIDVPGGSVTLNGEQDFVVKTVLQAESPEELENAIVRSNISAQHVRVKDVASVALKFKDEEILYRTNQKRGINLVIGKKKSADTIRVTAELRKSLDEYNEKIGNKLEYRYVNDISKFVKRRVTVLSNNLVVGLILVLIVLSIMLPFKMALVAAVGIPFSFLLTIIIFQLGDISLNLISMMGLIIVLGMLVDDAVVVTENAQKKIDEGYSPQEAAIKGTQEIWKPVTTSIATTLAAFLPLMFMSGVFGKFISNIPIGVVIALLVSLGECLFILPSHVGSWISASKAKPVRRGLWDKFMLKPYSWILGLFIRLRYVALLSVIALIGFSLWFAKNNMAFKLFPGAEDDNFKLVYETELGTPLEQTEQVSKKLESVVKDFLGSDLESIVTTVGYQPKSGMVAIGENRGSNYAKSTFFVLEKEKRSKTLAQIVDGLKPKLDDIEGVTKYSFEKGQAGPPQGKAVNIKVIGEDYQLVRQVVGEVKTFLEGVEGTTGVMDTYAEGKKEILVRMDQDKISLAGVDRLDVANTVRAMFDGIVVDELTKIDEKIEIVVTLPNEQKSDIKSLREIQIPNRRGIMIPLGSLAELETQQGVGFYEHLDGLRALQVQADVLDTKTTSQAVNSQLRVKTEELTAKYPGISFSYGGQDRDTKESFATLGTTFILALLGIFLLLILQFNNFYQPFIVLSVIPLGLLSVIWTFYFHSMPLSFLGIVGMIALAGVIVNNAIVLIDTANRLVQSGTDAKSAFKQAGIARLRPIFLTTITTTVGILPTAYGLGGKDDFVVPIALALGWGMFFGAFLTTLVLPTLLSISDDIRSGFARLFLRRRAS